MCLLFIYSLSLFNCLRYDMIRIEMIIKSLKKRQLHYIVYNHGYYWTLFHCIGVQFKNTELYPNVTIYFLRYSKTLFLIPEYLPCVIVFRLELFQIYKNSISNILGNFYFFITIFPNKFWKMEFLLKCFCFETWINSEDKKTVFTKIQ